VSDGSDLRAEQLARWACYPNRYVLKSAAVTALVGLVAHITIVYLLFDRHTPLRNAIAGALWFAGGLLLLVAASLLWTRHQARRGRRAWWLADPGQ
jgi:hypothetical protein